MLANHSQRGNGDSRIAQMLHALTPLDALTPVTRGRYLVKGWLDRGAFSCMFAPSNTGKSFVALDLAMHVAAGESWQGHRVGQPGPVIYVCAEGCSAFGNRIAAIRRVNPDLVARAAKGGMAVLPFALDLCRGKDALHLIDMIAEAADHPPALIVIDTLARSMGAGNENEGADMGALIAAVSLIQARTGAHVMVIHHTGKNADRGLRGHSSLRGALDTEIELVSVGGTIRVEAGKQRDQARGEAMHLRLRAVHIGDDEDGDPVTSAVIEAAEPATGRGALTRNATLKLEAEGRALAALRHLPTDQEFSAPEVSSALAREKAVNGKSQKSKNELTRRLLLKLVDLGRVKELDGGRFQVIFGGGV
jgi:hypothetical protein